MYHDVYKGKPTRIYCEGGEGWTNERPGTDHVISGPMRGLEKNSIRWRRQNHRQTDGHRDSMTESAQWGRYSENGANLFGVGHTKSAK